MPRARVRVAIARVDRRAERPGHGVTVNDTLETVALSTPRAIAYYYYCKIRDA